MQIRFLGSGQEVGRSCINIKTQKSNLLLDCGIKQGKKIQYPKINNLEPIDAIILSHAHVDHTAGLPILSQKNLLKENTPIYCTPPTAMITKILLWDSYKLQKEEWKKTDKNPEYEEEDVRKIIKKIKTVPYQKFSPTKDTKARLGNTGHILGSSWIQIMTGGKKIFYTGDIGEGRSTYLPPPTTPPKSDIIITESTYGNTHQHKSFTDVKNKLIELTNEEIPILIPSFAVGRSQEILRLLKTRPEIDSSRIYYDGMITSLLPIYNPFTSQLYMSEALVNTIKNSKTKPFHPKNAKTPKTMEDRKKIVKKEKAPIIIAPSGMLEGGWSTFYLKELTKHRKKAKIILVGYQSDNTVGKKLEKERKNNKKIKTKINALMPPKEANEPVEEYGYHETEIKVPSNWVHSLSEISTHASSNSLLETMRKTLPHQIYLVHGDKKATKSLKQKIQNDPTLKHTKTKIPKNKHSEKIKKEIPKNFKKRLKNLENRVKELEKNQKNNKND